MRRAKGLGRIVRGAFATRASSLRVDGTGAPSGKAAIAFCAVACVFGLLAAPAGAATPTHAELPALNQTGFERVCGLAVDSAGNRYVADYGADQVKIYSPAGSPITSFTPSANAESPCALAVDSNGNLYVNGKNTDVVKYKPEGGFPPTPSTTYVPDTSVNGTGVLVPAEAKGVAVDSATDDVYIPFSGHISSYDPDGTLISETLGEEATGGGAQFVSVDVRGSDGKIYAYNRTGKKAYVLSADGSQVLAEVNGSTTKGAGFPIALHAIAVDQSNGHFYIADIGGATGHRVVDEFDSGGELVSEIATPSALEEDSPSAVAVDNSGGENDGDVFVSAGVSPSSVLAFGPLTTPTHAELPALNQTGFERVCGLAVDSAGNRYVADYGADQVKIYSPAGSPITSFTPSANAESPCALAVDSNGNLYVNGKNTDVVKYKPEGGFPPTPSTTYVPDTSVNGTGVLVPAEAKGVAVDSATDDVYIPFSGHISSYDPDGTLISETLGEEATGGGAQFVSVDVRGSDGKIYAYNRTGKKAYVLSADGSQVLAEVNGSTTKGAGFPIALHAIAVDQSNGHFYIADIGGATGHRVVDEFDSGGELVSEIATPSALEEDSPSAVAVDNSGGENDGDVFVSAGVSPSSVLAFGPLTYAEFFELKVTRVGAGQGTVTSAPAGIDCGTTCKVTFQEGTEVTLSAVAAAGSKFSRWEGCDTVVGSECKVTMSAKHQVTVRFTAKPAIETESVSPRDTSTLLEATINPNGEEASYQFEFLSEAAYQANGKLLWARRTTRAPRLPRIDWQR